MWSTSCIINEPLSKNILFIEGLYPPILPLSMIMFFLSMNSFCSYNVSVLKVDILDCYEKVFISSHPPAVHYTFTSVNTILYKTLTYAMQYEIFMLLWFIQTLHIRSFKVKIGPYFSFYLLPPNLPLSSNIVHLNFFNS